VERTAESIRDGVTRVCTDHDYRRRLETGARQYYLEHVAPVATVRRALAIASREQQAFSIDDVSTAVR
jgi:hypothetical protein